MNPSFANIAIKIPVTTALITIAPDISEINFLMSLKIFDCMQKLLRFGRVFTKSLTKLDVIR